MIVVKTGRGGMLTPPGIDVEATRDERAEAQDDDGHERTVCSQVRAGGVDGPRRGALRPTWTVGTRKSPHPEDDMEDMMLAKHFLERCEGLACSGARR
mmetsp:Transcript_48964/g.158158  ORF Transcript_48964/g.158158 Transcript_48964/m.158158 type:complete len:98 (+) Transcript_48964:80-373(+)